MPGLRTCPWGSALGRPSWLPRAGADPQTDDIGGRSSGMLGHLDRHQARDRRRGRRLRSRCFSVGARCEQPGVLGQQAPVVDRSGGSGSSLGLPAVDRGAGAGRCRVWWCLIPALSPQRAVLCRHNAHQRGRRLRSRLLLGRRARAAGVLGQQAPVVDRSGWFWFFVGFTGGGSGAGRGFDAECGVACFRHSVRREPCCPTAGSFSPTGSRKRQTPPSPVSAPQLSTPSSQRSVSASRHTWPQRGGTVRFLRHPAGVSLTSETIRRSPAESGSDVWRQRRTVQ